jgi:hypothetical protein
MVERLGCVLIKSVCLLEMTISICEQLLTSFFCNYQI